MQYPSRPMELLLKKKQKSPSCFCCNSRLSLYSPDHQYHQYHHHHHSSNNNNISSLAHTMVQERLDQMIREEAAMRRPRRRSNTNNGQFIVMVAMEKFSHDPKQDFRMSMKEMISANSIYQPDHLRQLLNCFLSMNSSDFRGVILQVFHEVCCDVFLSD